MRPLYRLFAVILFAFMFRSSLWRAQQSTTNFIKREIDGRGLLATYGGFKPLYIEPAVIRHQSNMSRPTGLIADKGLELLTFTTPNGQ